MSAEAPLSGGVHLSAGATVHPVSATPVVALAVVLLVLAVTSVLLISWLLYWRSGRR
ncbi:MAG: hypothetical protein M0Z30_02965 [Actinomycetota bacterium]|nr:hypothetical protein [Actinomycetota bacterium]